MCQQVNPEFLDSHRGSFTAQHFEPHRGFEIAQIQLCVPAAFEQRFQGSLGRLTRAAQRRDQNLVARFQLPNLQPVRHLLVVSLAHPRWAFPGLFQTDQMIARPQALTSPKVGTAPTRAILLKHTINAPALQFTQQEIGRVVGISQQNIASVQRIEHRPQQGLLIATLAAKTTQCRIQHCTAGEADDANQPTNRKAQSWLLPARLRIGGLISRCIRHRHRRAIHQPNRPAHPLPCLG